YLCRFAVRSVNTLARGFSGRPSRPLHVRCYPFASSPANPSLLTGPGGFACLAGPAGEPEQPTVRLDPSNRVPPSLITSVTGAGISTGQPSPAPFGLGLGPTNLKRTNLP